MHELAETLDKNAASETEHAKISLDIQQKSSLGE